MSTLLELLKTLDPLDDTLWTDDGLPALDAVKALSGDNKLTRATINKVALGLTRANVLEYTAAPEPVAETIVEEVKVEVVVPEVKLDEVDALLAKIESLRTEQTTKQAEIKVKQDEVAALVKQISDLEITIPYREIQLKNQREALEAMNRRNAIEDAERAAKMAKLKELGLSPDELLNLLPNSAELRYDRII